MKNIKLHASPHPAESAAACPKVWDTEGDSRDLVGRCSLNLRRQNLRRSAELCAFVVVLLLVVVVLLLVVVDLRCCLLLDKVVLLRRLLLVCLVRRPTPPPPPPPTQPITADHICPKTCN